MVTGPEEGISGRGGRGGQSRGRGSRGRAPTRHNAGKIIKHANTIYKIEGTALHILIAKILKCK